MLFPFFQNARVTSPGSFAVYYNQGGVLAILLKGGRVTQFRLLSDAVGRVTIGDQPTSFVSKAFGTVHELLAYYKTNEINPMLPILRDCIPLLGKGAGIKRKVPRLTPTPATRSEPTPQQQTKIFSVRSTQVL